jgi:hypothetical protein
MKGIYLTAKAKQEIEAKIIETERKFMHERNFTYKRL